MITIIDYGMGNLGSVTNMLKKIGFKSVISSNIEEIRNSEKIILPGVGAFDTAIKRIDELGLRDVIKEAALIKKTPLLGICLGMQLLMDDSKEGNLEGLGLINGNTLNFKNNVDSSLKIPHMGWNNVTISKKCRLTEGFTEDFRFYFVHSYYVKVKNLEDSMLKCDYGISFDAAICRDNIFGAQFHPEKSHKFGMQFLKNFASI